MKRFYTICSAIAALTLSSTLHVQAADKVILQGLPPQTGTISGYSKKFFELKNAQGQTVRIKADRVSQIKFGAPLEAYLTFVGGKQLEDIRVKSYEKPFLVVHQNGHDVRHNLSKVKSIELAFTSERLQEVTDIAEIISEGEEVDIISRVTPGPVTLVHFHAPQSPVSTKLQDYISRLQSMDPKHVRYLKIVTRDWNTPVSKQYELRTLPQVWIYDAAGTLRHQLAENITPRAIDDAVTAGQRARDRSQSDDS